jgi:excisionase family DNA binding protein
VSDSYLTTGEVCERVRRCRSTVYSWVKAGLLRPLRPMPGAPMLFRPGDVDAALERAGAATVALSQSGGEP